MSRVTAQTYVGAVKSKKKNGEWFVGRRPVSHPGCLGSTPRGSGGMGQHLQRIAAWFRGRTPLSEARGLGSTPRGFAGLGRLLRRIAAWFRGRTPLSEARGLGSIPRGSGGLGRLLLGPWSVPWRIAAWFGVRTPLSEARGLGSIPRGAGLCRGKSPHGSEAGHRFQKHEAWVRFPAAQVVWHGYHNCTLRELHERTIDWNPAMIDLKMISLFQSSPFNDSLADLCFGTLAIAHVV